MAENTLCVVDMQTYFSASQEEWLIQNVLREIRGAKRRGNGIIFLEYTGCGSTDSRLLDELSDYNRWTRQVKTNGDGAQQIVDATTLYAFSKRHFIVLGVETDACVCDTIKGLALLEPGARITVPADCVNMLGRTNQRTGVKGFYQLRQVNLKHCKRKLPANKYDI